MCVDDDAHVVEAIVLHLRKQYQVSTALSGHEGLKTLKRIGGAAVVISDMRMPGMDGATFLNKVMHIYPDVFLKHARTLTPDLPKKPVRVLIRST